MDHVAESQINTEPPKYFAGGSRGANDRVILLVIIFIAFGARLAYLVEYTFSDWWDALIMDPGNHWDLAGRIAAGEGMGPYAFFRAPFYLYLLAGFRALFGDSLWPIRVLQLFLGTSVCGMIFILGRRLMHPALAFVAAFIYSCWWVPVYFDGELLTESPATFLNLLLLLLLDRADDAGPRQKRWLAWAGLTAGLSAITRPNILLFAAAAALVLGVRCLAQFRSRGEWRGLVVGTAMFVVGVGLPIAPVTLRNLILADDLVLIASQGGINFWLGNHAGADGRTVVVPVPRRDIPLDFLNRRPDHPWLREDVWISSAYGADTGMKRRSTESEISDYWYGQAWDWVRAHPGDFLTLTAKKALYLFQDREVSNNRDLLHHRSQFWILSICRPSFGLIAPLALVGIGVALMKERRRRWLWPLLFVGFYGASVVMFFVTTRYRVPMFPALVLFAALAVEQTLAWAGSGKWQRAAATVLVVGLLAVAVNVDWPKWNDRPLRSAMRYNLGIALFEQGKYQGAEGEFRAAVEIKDNYPEAWFWLGRTLSVLGRPKGSTEALEKSIEQAPGYAPAHLELARRYAELGDQDKARRHLQIARELAPGLFSQ